MARINYFEQIHSRIEAIEAGDVFIISDFSDLADEATVRKALSRLEEDGKIRRVMRGIYDKPQYSDFLDEITQPNPDKIAKALARNYGWTIVPCGDTALNMLGLSTQVPAVWHYVSDGNYREYTCGNVVIRFKRTTNKEISQISFKTALVIQAIKALGRSKINNEVINAIRTLTTEEEKKIMFAEAKYATAWIYDIIKGICKDSCMSKEKL